MSSDDSTHERGVLFILKGSSPAKFNNKCVFSLGWIILLGKRFWTLLCGCVTATTETHTTPKIPNILKPTQKTV